MTKTKNKKSVFKMTKQNSNNDRCKLCKLDVCDNRSHNRTTTTTTTTTCQLKDLDEVNQRDSIPFQQLLVQQQNDNSDLANVTNFMNYQANGLFNGIYLQQLKDMMLAAYLLKGRAYISTCACVFKRILSFYEWLFF